MTPEPAANAKATWKRRQQALAFETPAKWAMQLAVLASLGALAAWCLVLFVHGSSGSGPSGGGGPSGGDVRRSGGFWLLVVLFGIWGAPVQAYARWTMLSLRFFIVLWPLLAAAAFVFDADPALFGIPAGPGRLSWGWMGGLEAYTVMLSAAAYAALRRSSLPGGATRPVLHEDGYRPATALPDIDPQLRSTQIWFTFPLIANVLSLSITAAVVFTHGADPDIAGTAVMATLAVILAAEIGLLAWGQYQGRRAPSRKPPAWTALAILQVGLAAALAAALLGYGAVAGRPGVLLAGVVIAAGAAITAACARMVWTRMGERAGYYANR